MEHGQEVYVSLGKGVKVVKVDTTGQLCDIIAEGEDNGRNPAQ